MQKDTYTLKKLLEDKSFEDFVRSNEGDNYNYWNIWILQSPANKELAEMAIQIMRGIEFQKVIVPLSEVDEEWVKLKPALENDIKYKENSFTFKYYRQIAAVFIVIILFTGIYTLIRTSKIVRNTGYGEQLTITLPDESTVVLNGNSALRYPKTWNEDGFREVWLEGDAYFSIKRKQGKANSRFLVHTSKLTVEVLGTTFNVSNRKERTQVVLNTGKVKINGNTTHGPQNLYMKPGDLVEYNERSGFFKKTVVQPELYTSWTKKKLIFNETSIKDILFILEENYGLDVDINKSLLYEKKLTGEISVENADELLNALSKSFNIKISRKSNKVKIENK